MKKVMMTILAATFVGFVACNEKPAEEAEVVEEVVEEVVTEEPAVEVAEGDTAAAPAEAPAAQ